MVEVKKTERHGALGILAIKLLTEKGVGATFTVKELADYTGMFGGYASAWVRNQIERGYLDQPESGGPYRILKLIQLSEDELREVKAFKVIIPSIAELREHLKTHPEELVNAPKELEFAESEILRLSARLLNLKAYRERQQLTMFFAGERLQKRWIVFDKGIKTLNYDLVYAGSAEDAIRNIDPELFVDSPILGAVEASECPVCGQSIKDYKILKKSSKTKTLK